MHTWPNSASIFCSYHQKQALEGHASWASEAAEKDSSQEAHGETPLFFQKFSEKEFKPHHQRVSWSGTVTHVLPTSQSLAFALCLWLQHAGHWGVSEHMALLRWCEGSIRNQKGPESLPTAVVMAPIENRSNTSHYGFHLEDSDSAQGMPISSEKSGGEEGKP